MRVIPPAPALAETLTHESDFTGVDRACDAILADRSTGWATEAQATWALLWKARSRMSASSLEMLADAPELARMAAALAVESGPPGLTYESHCVLGEICGVIIVQGVKMCACMQSSGTAACGQAAQCTPVSSNCP